MVLGYHIGSTQLVQGMKVSKREISWAESVECGWETGDSWFF